MRTLKTKQIITCSSLEDARVKADIITNGIIAVKNDIYTIVNYKTFTELTKLGYKQVR
jgi:hypothetical protein